MKIIEYEDRYLEDVKDLLVELEEYILSIDEDNLDQLHPEYRDKMAMLDLEKVNNNSKYQEYLSKLKKFNNTLLASSSLLEDYIDSKVSI